MIDLHCHLLPGVDDGATDMAAALEMARVALDDGVSATACTPHIYPGLYQNSATSIRAAVNQLRDALAAAGLNLEIREGAEIHLAPELITRLRQQAYPTIEKSRYFLLELPYHTAPVRFIQTVGDCLELGYVPIIAHPERLGWLGDGNYEWLVQAVRAGAWLQVTATSLTGQFGCTARCWAERLLDEGLVHMIASDGHDAQHRPPLVSAGRGAAARWVGEEEAGRLVFERPAAVLADREPSRVAPPPGVAVTDGATLPARHPPDQLGWVSRLLDTTQRRF